MHTFSSQVQGLQEQLKKTEEDLKHAAHQRNFYKSFYEKCCGRVHNANIPLNLEMINNNHEADFKRSDNDLKIQPVTAVSKNNFSSLKCGNSMPSIIFLTFEWRRKSNQKLSFFISGWISERVWTDRRLWAGGCRETGVWYVQVWPQRKWDRT